jgi:hypothetical protein
MTELADYQWEIGDVDVDGVVIGAGTAFPVGSFRGTGMPDQRTQDTPAPQDDGGYFGADYLEPKDLEWSLGVKTPGDDEAAADLKALLQRVWTFDERRTPGAVMQVRCKMPGRPVRVAYGRPRKFDPIEDLVVVGWVPIEASFRMADPRFYADEAQQLTLGVVPPLTGGFHAPIVAPITLSPIDVADRPGWITCWGSELAWPQIRFVGRLVRPYWFDVTQSRYVELDLTIPDGRWIDVDTRPGRRTITWDDGSSAAGALTRRSTFAGLESGQHEIRFGALDADATAEMHMTWRDAYTSL